MSKKPFWILSALAAAVVVMVACGGGEKPAATQAQPAAATPAAPAVDQSKLGSITGTISFTGADPDTVIKMDADPKCLEMHKEPVYTQTVETDGNGHLEDVFVYVKDGLGAATFPAPTDKVVMHQQGCMYHPHVYGIMVGQPLVIRNDDETLHNVHAQPGANTEFNQGQPFQGMEFEKTFDQPEVCLHFKCDVHPWMSAYACVVTSPYYAVSGQDGTYKIDKLPPGTYTIEAWQESLGTRTQQVTVGEGQSVEAAFDFTKPAG
jgi:plastocyanin